MPTTLLEKGKLDKYIDIDKEILRPKQRGYYSEAISRLDAYIDTLLDSLVRQVYSVPESKKLLNVIENSLRSYEYFSGLIKLEVLRKTEISNWREKLIFPSRALKGEIKKFKEFRNAVLHSDIGHYNLIDANRYVSNKRYQREAKENANSVIDLGIKISNELFGILQDNEKIIKTQKIITNEKERGVRRSV